MENALRKVGLVSVRNFNYGSILQAYALQQELFDAGLDNELIYYKKRNVLKQAVRVFNIPLLVAKIKDVKRIMQGKINPELRLILEGRNKAFSKFVKESFTFSPCLAGRKKLIKYTKKFDAFILGSDQVWNPMLLGGDYYTLTWANDKCPKVAYASSFGVKEIPKNQIKKTKHYLSRFSMISVREQQGAEIVKKMIGRDARVCCDPTLLTKRDRWDVLSGDEPLISKLYIFCYFIGNNPEQRDFAKRLAEYSDLKILAVKHIDEYIKNDDAYGDIDFLEAGPREFVNFIRYASYVCTDSFHGTVFSLLYNKPFFTFKRFSDTKAKSTNSRVINLLKMVGLETRLFENTIKPEDVLNCEIDWGSVNTRISAFRSESRNYFDEEIKCLKGV
ncbi:MAG: polysaccharide pyruvyl transferase family protein [Lachnospiraceae bacterium]|nr:polysaccharide pyruvyl transferase family protein [Lachnospiraceae bacterium]